MHQEALLFHGLVDFDHRPRASLQETVRRVVAALHLLPEEASIPQHLRR